MEHTKISDELKNVSRVGLGTWAIGGWLWGGTDESDSIKTIHEALDSGINLIDTAPVYGFGKSEEIVGKAVQEYGKRDQIFIATKAGLSWKGEQIYRDARKEILIEEVEKSLKRLQVDVIDLYQLHWNDPLVPLAEVAETFLQLKQEGKIKAIGASNLSPDQMKEFREHAPLHSLQPPYNLFEREIEGKELNYCKENSIALLGYGSLCRGLLSGKMDKDREFEGDDIRKKDPKFQEPRFSDYLKCTVELEAWVKKKYDRPLIALAVRWVLDKGVNVALWGARKPQQLEPLSSLWGWKLTAEDFNEIETILEKTINSPVGPEFMAPPDRQKAELGQG